MYVNIDNNRNVMKCVTVSFFCTYKLVLDLMKTNVTPSETRWLMGSILISHLHLPPTPEEFLNNDLLQLLDPSQDPTTGVVVESTPPTNTVPQLPACFSLRSSAKRCRSSMVLAETLSRTLLVRYPGSGWKSSALNFYMYFHVASCRMRKMQIKKDNNAKSLKQHTKNMLFISRFILKYNNHNKIQPRPPTQGIIP